jgi:hypothetical protein
MVEQVSAEWRVKSTRRIFLVRPIGLFEVAIANMETIDPTRRMVAPIEPLVITGKAECRWRS